MNNHEIKSYSTCFNFFVESNKIWSVDLTSYIMLGVDFLSMDQCDGYFGGLLHYAELWLLQVRWANEYSGQAGGGKYRTI